jgi:hypothetical protein
MKLTVSTTAGRFDLECVDAGALKAAIESGQHVMSWLPTTDGGVVLGSSIVAIAKAGPSPTAESLREAERWREITEDGLKKSDADTSHSDLSE